MSKYCDEVLGHDCDGREIYEGDVLADMWRTFKETEDLEDPRLYYVVVADDGKAYAISINDNVYASEIRNKEHIPDNEDIPQLIKPINTMGYYEIGDYPSIANNIDIEELRKIVSTRLKEKPIEKDIIDFNGDILAFKRKGMSIGEISDGNYSFNQYKDALDETFVELCISYFDYAWKKRTPSKETFIAGINTPKGVVTRTVSMEYWNNFDVQELEEIPEYDRLTAEERKIRMKSLRELKNK